MVVDCQDRVAQLICAHGFIVLARHRRIEADNLTVTLVLFRWQSVYFEFPLHCKDILDIANDIFCRDKELIKIVRLIICVASNQLSIGSDSARDNTWVFINAYFKRWTLKFGMRFVIE